MKCIHYLLLTLSLAGCQSLSSTNYKTSTKQISIEGSSFEQVTQSDKADSDWYAVELRPTKLPYTGALGKKTAQERWLLMFHAMQDIIQEKCAGNVAQEPLITGEQHNYTAYPNTLEQPKYLKARFVCAK